MLSFEKDAIQEHLLQVLKQNFPKGNNFFKINEWEPDLRADIFGCIGAEVHTEHSIISLVMVTQHHRIEDTNQFSHKNKKGDVFLQFYDPIPNAHPIKDYSTNITHRYVTIISDPNISTKVGEILEARAKQRAGASGVLVPEMRDEISPEYIQ